MQRFVIARNPESIANDDVVVSFKTRDAANEALEREVDRDQFQVFEVQLNS
jgi:hypothetical protein